MTDESNAFLLAEITLDSLESLNQEGAEGSELFDGFELLDREHARKIFGAGRDDHGNLFPGSLDGAQHLSFTVLIRAGLINMHLLYRAARQGVFGKCEPYSRSSITDALFVYLEGDPEPESIDRLDSNFRNRPLVCLTKGWEEHIKTWYPDAAIYRRTMMKPACRFILPDNPELPEGYRLAGMDETAFEQHPFSHGRNYSGWDAFQAEGSGAVVYYGGKIVAAASSFLSVKMKLSWTYPHGRITGAKNWRRPVLPGCCRTA